MALIVNSLCQMIIMIYDIHKLVALIPGQKKTQQDCFYINNPDGSVRWLWPVHNDKPDFLKFYNVSTLKAKAFSMVMQVIFRLHIQSWIFKRISLNLSSDMGKRWALFTGTVGVQQKMLLYRNDAFTKIPVGIQAKASLNIEKRTLQSLEKKQFSYFQIPTFLGDENATFSQAAFSGNEERTNHYSPLHTKATREIFSQNKLTSYLEVTQSIQCIQIALSSLGYNDKLPRGLYTKLVKVVHQMGTSIATEYGFAHGDFTPWNMYKADNKLYIYDWEAATEYLPKGFDNFHFIIQKGILTDRKSWSEIKLSLHENLMHGESPLFSTMQEFDHYLKLYLLYNISIAMKKYVQQEKWHVQIYWMIDVWNDAIDELENEMNDRSKFICSVFDHLKACQYATLKAFDAHPIYWPEESDIDLLVHKKDLTYISQYCKVSPLVDKMNTNSSSFMSTLELWFKDGSYLSLDLVHQLKRKATVFLNANSLLQEVKVNDFGIKILQPKNEAKYIAWFYALNHAPIPAKYKRHHFNVEKSTTGTLLLEYYKGNHEASQAMQHIANSRCENQGIRGWLNKVNYIFDTIKSFLRFDGFVITFSGVDGAGKSTIIEKIKSKIEKNLRKEVIILRHRPSIIPIISALQHGKQKAEALSVSKLPRTGQNKNILSSILRFGYYYMDYLFGQFYIYTKYVMRGKVVMYDRYYFDFINDSRRSNIQLPKSWIKFGYKFLLKPDLNYFLFADAKTILSRKQELDEKTIESLTHNYKSLFESYSKHYESSIYMAINNEILDDTLALLFSSIKSKVAQA